MARPTCGCGHRHGGQVGLDGSLAADPPDGVHIVPFFVTSRWAEQNDRVAFTDVVTERSHRALRRLVTDPAQPLDEATLVTELLSGPDSSAGRLLANLGVDADAVRAPRPRATPDPDTI
jgi:hypothetical protein